MTNLYPLKLAPVAKSAIWGGQRLRRDWDKQSNLDAIAETWELTVRPNENNIIKNGPFEGENLQNVLKKWGNQAIGADFNNDRFPLLVKFIDAADRLSVQVHPDDDFAGTFEHDLGKTEMWYVVEADPGATILMGLIEGATKADFAAAATAGNPEPLLRCIQVQKGDCFFIPAGMPHAIGKGVLIAEIQQNCDLTYRVFDYNRRDKNGNLRELHVEKAMQVVRPFSEAEVNAIRYANGVADGTLVSCPYFTVKRADIADTWTATVEKDSFQSLLFLAGEGTVCANGHSVTFRKGDSIFLPAGMGSYTVSGSCEMLISTL